MGGVLANSGPEMVEISDKAKIAKQGYDKFSFRRPPGGKKKRKHK